MDIRDYVQLNYDKIQNILKKEYHKLNSLGDFDYDLFHDTILKTICNLEGKEIDEGVMSYIITAFKTNYIRLQNYSYIKNRVDCDDFNQFDNQSTEFFSSFEIQDVINELKQNFGSEYTEYFVLWCKGYSVKELSEKYGVNDLYYKFKLIKKFLSKYIQNSL